MRAGGFPGNPGGLVVSILKVAGGRAPAHQARGRGHSRQVVRVLRSGAGSRPRALRTLARGPRAT